jgi:AcrR family transcriptional regulator
LKRFSKSDWLDLGLKRLAKAGPDVLRIDVLCIKAKRSKGSFYHHFAGRDDFVQALMAHWEQALTHAIIEETEKSKTAAAKLKTLAHIISGTDMTAERALRRWAGTEKIVAEAIAKVDKRRIDYVAKLIGQAKKIPPQTARDLAVMNYASLVGFQMMFQNVSAARYKRIDKIYEILLQNWPDR